MLKEQTVSDPKQLISELKKLNNKHPEQYIFRGQADANWKLIPNGLRDETLHMAVQDFPVPENEIQKWIRGDKVNLTVKGWLGRKPLNSEVLLIKRFFDLNIHIMRYNFRLANYFEENAILEWKKRNNGRNADFWTKEKTFIYIIENESQNLIGRFFLDGSWQPPKPNEVLTGIDETLPQHYGVPTAALDFSYDPYVALFFGLDLANEPEYNLKTNLFIAKKIPSEAKYFSIYAYKQIEDVSKPCVSIENPDETLGNNERAKNQQGVFTYFNNPCSFYLYNNSFYNACFPSLNDYDQEFQRFPERRCFELIQFKVEKNKEMCAVIKETLSERGITKEFLFP